jgi:hypothetical protein
MKTDSRLGGERRYVGTVELRSWYSGSDEIDFVVGSRVRRGKEGKKGFSCTSSFSKRWASGRSVWGSVWGLGNRTRNTVPQQKADPCKDCPCRQWGEAVVEGKNEQRLFAFCFAPPPISGGISLL